MKVPVRLPDLGIEPVVFSLWFNRPGDRVSTGERLAEVVGPSTTFDVQAPCDGILVEQRTFPNDDLSTGQVLAVIETSSLTSENH